MKNKLFIALFFLISILPLVWMFFPENSQEVANEVSAKPPVLVTDGKLNVDYPGDLSRYFDDHFGFRRQMIALHNKLVATVFQESAEEKVILGKDGWLFYQETLDDYQSTNAMTEQEITDICTALSLMQEYCRDKGMKFAFTIVPNKNTLYGEKMPDNYHPYRENANGVRLSRALKQSDVLYVDLFDALQQTDRILYRRTDSHWTEEGAGLAADKIAEALQLETEPFYGSATRQVEAPVGDLYEMLFLSERDEDFDVVYERTPEFSYLREIRSVEDNFIRTVSSKGEGKLFMFRDSFGNNLHTLMAEQFEAGTFCRLNPYNFTLAEGEGADVVVLEIVERNLEWLLSKPAIFPAPERETTQIMSENADEKCRVTWEAAEELPGYQKVIGEWNRDEEYHKIYLSSNGMCYEMTPKAGGFVGYLPSGQEKKEWHIQIEK